MTSDLWDCSFSIDLYLAWWDILIWVFRFVGLASASFDLIFVSMWYVTTVHLILSCDASYVKCSQMMLFLWPGVDLAIKETTYNWILYLRLLQIPTSGVTSHLTDLMAQRYYFILVLVFGFFISISFQISLYFCFF